MASLSTLYLVDAVLLITCIKPNYLDILTLMIKGNSIHGGIFVIEIAKSCQNRYCNKDVFLVEKVEQIFLILISLLAKNAEVQNHLYLIVKKT